MKHLLPSILLLTLLFPSLAQGQSLDEWIGKGKGLLGKGKGYLCETTGVGCPESVDFKDLVKRDGLYFKKRTDVPFTGITTGDEQGSLKNGKRVGPWVEYYSNGQLLFKGTYKDGKQHGSWVKYYDNGRLEREGTYKDGKRDGPWVTFTTSGHLYSKETYKDGKKNGPWVSYYKFGGQVESLTGFYRNDKKISDYMSLEEGREEMDRLIRNHR